ncbi:hypothetical protein XENORESO_005019, partial [Xenotaenia resolanae]
TSISRMSSKEKIGLHEREKHPPPALPSSPAVDEEEEGQTGQSQAKASSSSSSEEESESESDTESEKAKNREIINNLNNKRNTTSGLSTSMSASATASQLKKEPSKPPATESPGSWRTSLRKAGSSVTLGSAGLSDSIQDTSRTTDSGLGMSRSASSPRLSSEAETKEPRLARVPPTPTRRLFSIPDNSADSSNRWDLAVLGREAESKSLHMYPCHPVSLSLSWLSRSSSYSRRLHSQLGNEFTSSTPSLLHSSSYVKRLDDANVTSASTGTSSAGLSRLNSLLAQRIPQEQMEKKEPPSTNTSVSQSMTTSEQESKQRRK